MSAAWNCSGQWIFRNKLHIYPDLGCRLSLITTSLVSGSAYQLVCNSREAHDLTAPAARIVGSRWMTEGKIHDTSKIVFMIMNARSKVKLSYSDIGPRSRL